MTVSRNLFARVAAARARGYGLTIVLFLALSAGACDDDDDDDLMGGAPEAPRNLVSFTGDNEVILAWERPGGDVESHNVYAFISETGSFEVIGVTTSTAFLDNDVVNGQTYRYRVTAVDSDGDESEFSNETFDTPRPDAFNVLVTSTQADPTQAGFDLTQDLVVDATSPSATFRFDEAGGVARIVPLNGAEVVNVGFVDALGTGCSGECLNFAPESGYFPEPVQAFVGNAYVFRIPRAGDRFFGAIRIAHIAPGVLVFDWAFQTAPGNRELLRLGAARLTAGLR